MTIGQIDTNLRRFYAEARKKTGEPYSRSSLVGFRHSIEIYLNFPPHQRNLKISTDPRFNRSNQMLDAQIVSLKRSGKENVVHKPPLEDEDLLKLKFSQALSLNNPLALLRNVWFHIVLFFCRRGSEGQRLLKCSSFKFEVDGAGRRYATMAHDELSKNHPGGVKDIPSHEKYARMYETDQQNDGYKALKLYQSKLNPKTSAFFQYPKRNWRPEDDVWYEAKPVGVNKLNAMMKNISEAAALSKVYTNHSVRATAITLWSNAGVPNRHIMAISRHRNEQSLVHYNARPSTSQLYNCSEVLSRSLTANSSSGPVCINSTSQVIKNSLVVPAAEITTAGGVGFGSIFNNCTIQNVHIVTSSNEITR